MDGKIPYIGVDIPNLAFGSGSFGEWIEDAFGLPAYRYTCDQRRDPKAITPVNLIWRSPTDHSHQVGNDRLVAVASNYGYVQVRQDEGSPKYPGQTFFDEKILQGELSGTPFGSGINWTDFPVMDMHPHAWSIYAIPKLLGVKFTPEGVELSPCLPKEAYRFESPLLRLEKNSRCVHRVVCPQPGGEMADHPASAGPQASPVHPPGS